MREEPQGRSEENKDKKLGHRVHTSKNLHRALFDTTPQHRTLEEIVEGVRQYMKSRTARH